MRKALVATALALSGVAALFPAAPAAASTCEISEDTLDGVVCVIVYDPVVRAACTVVNKLKLDCLA
jgi:hypothetical protein